PHVERAIEDFGRAIGEPAPKVAVVLFRSNAALVAGFDEAPLARRGLATRRMLTEESHRQATTQRTAGLVGAMGVVLGSAPGGAGVRVAGVLQGPTAVVGVGLEPGDVIKSLNGAEVTTLAEFVGRFDALAVGAPVELEVTRGGSMVPLEFAKPAGSLGRPLAAPAQQQEQRGPGGPLSGWGAVLAHETAHTLLDAYVRARLGPHPPATGPRLAAWLHEAVAQLVEFPTAEARAPRRATARQLIGSHTPLAELFTMDHPMSALVQGGRGSAPDPVGVTSIALPRGSAGRLATFYPQAFSVLEFLIARAGPEIVPRLALGLASGKTVGQVLAEAKAPLPTDPAALEREWAAWVAAPGPAAQ
ncbi:MAG TPA: PDZ domain-containing protein, partial [Longimicrobium sp.]|nr:PDZ domain-containing protein [Longimicrobium sp.]